MAELPDIPRIYTALAQWLACVVIICSVEKLRLTRLWQVAICILFLIAQSALLVLTVDILGVLWVLFMVISWILMYGLIFSLCATSMLKACYYAIHAFVLAEFGASLAWQIHTFLLLDHNVEVALMLSAYVVIFIGAWFVIKRFIRHIESIAITRRHLVTAAVIAVSVFAISNLGFLTARTPFSGHYHREIFNIRTIMGLSGLFFLGAYNMAIRETYAQRELSAVEGVLRSQYEQYQHSKDSRDYISRKHHDMKHQIAYLRAEEDPERKKIFLDAMEEEIERHELSFQTGNHVLDTILSANKMFCAKNSINLTCVANGELLNFIDTMDICSIFGNALDNAIEHAKKIDDKDKRLIHLAIYSKKKQMIIRVENYMEGKLSFDDNLPVTTKPESTNHGYGLKSIRYVAEKYSGTMNVKTENSWFILQVVIPIAQQNCEE